MIDALFRHLLDATLLCLFFCVLACCFRHHAASLRHSVWFISLLKFSIPTALLAAAGARMAFVFPASAWISAVAARLTILLANLANLLPSPIETQAASVVARVVLPIWLFGFVGLFVAWLCRLRQSSGALFAASSEEEAALDRVKQKFGFHAPIAIRCSEERNEPGLLGIVRPRIAIPRGLSSQLSKAEFETLLLHELAHARRHDNLVSTFVHCLVCLFWFHPLLWFVEKQLLAEREQACDEIVVNSGVAPQVYVTGLIKVCKFHLFGDVAGISAANGSELGARLDRILAHRVKRPVSYFARIATVAFAISLALLPIAGGYCQQCVSNNQEPALKTLAK